MMRWDIVKAVAERFGYQSYLEIGCEGDETFSRVPCPFKVGVDPHVGGTLRCTSDEFFHRNSQTFDLIFIDGWHEASFVLRDALNAARALSPGGRLVFHDCLPTTEAMQRSDGNHQMTWTGDGWKVIDVLRYTPPFVLEAVCQDDWGCGIFRLTKESLPTFEALWPSVEVLSWADFVRSRAEWPLTWGQDLFAAISGR